MARDGSAGIKTKLHRFGLACALASLAGPVWASCQNIGNLSATVQDSGGAADTDVRPFVTLVAGDIITFLTSLQAGAGTVRVDQTGGSGTPPVAVLNGAPGTSGTFTAPVDGTYIFTFTADRGGVGSVRAGFSATCVAGGAGGNSGDQSASADGSVSAADTGRLPTTIIDLPSATIGVRNLPYQQMVSYTAELRAYANVILTELDLVDFGDSELRDIFGAGERYNIVFHIADRIAVADESGNFLEAIRLRGLLRNWIRVTTELREVEQAIEDFRLRPFSTSVPLGNGVAIRNDTFRGVPNHVGSVGEPMLLSFSTQQLDDSPYAIWGRLKLGIIDGTQARSGHTAHGQIGLVRSIGTGRSLGFFGSLFRSDIDTGATNTNVVSTGLGLGAYVKQQHANGLTSGLSASYERSQNDITVGATTGQFTRDYYTLDASVSRLYIPRPDLTVTPTLGLAWSRSDRHAYTDSAAVTHAARSDTTLNANIGANFSLVQLADSPRIDTITWTGGATISVGLQQASAITFASGAVIQSATVSGSVNLGVSYAYAGGGTLSLGLGASGLGASSQHYTGSIRYDISF